MDDGNYFLERICKEALNGVDRWLGEEATVSSMCGAVAPRVSELFADEEVKTYFLSQEGNAIAEIIIGLQGPDGIFNDYDLVYSCLLAIMFGMYGDIRPNDSNIIRLLSNRIYHLEMKRHLIFGLLWRVSASNAPLSRYQLDQLLTHLPKEYSEHMFGELQALKARSVWPYTIVEPPQLIIEWNFEDFGQRIMSVLREA